MALQRIASPSRVVRTSRTAIKRSRSKRKSSAANIARGACPRASPACFTYRFCYRGCSKGIPLGEKGHGSATFCYSSKGVLSSLAATLARSFKAVIFTSKHGGRRLSPRLARVLNLSVSMQRPPP